MNQKSILSISLDHQDFILELRHKLHEIPELRWKEEKTLAFIENEIKKILKTTKIQMKFHKKKGGIYVDLNLNPDYKRLLFRADIDALPIQEKTGLSFSSNHKGLMHACGHDCHAAMLLVALKILAEGSVLPCYNLRLIWQRAEELGLFQQSGASCLIKEGILDGVSFCYGLHISSVHEYGTFTSKPGYFMCQADHLKIEIECSGGHVMNPQLGSNGIDLLTDIHMSLRKFEFQELALNKMINFVPVMSKAGVTPNIRPGKGKVLYAVRHFLSSEKLQYFIESIQSRIESIVKKYPQSRLSTFKYSPVYPSLINDIENYTFIKSLINIAEMKTHMSPLVFSAEDFSYYLEKCVGSYWCLGAKKGQQTNHHTATFNPDESVLWQGVAFWLLIATTHHPEKRSLISQNQIEFMAYA